MMRLSFIMESKCYLVSLRIIQSNLINRMEKVTACAMFQQMI